MSNKPSKLHKSSDETTETPENDTVYKTVPFSAVTHNVDAYILIADDNYIYETCADQHRQFCAITDDRGNKDQPYHIGSFSPSWELDESEYEAGFYRSKTGLGRLDDDGEVVPYHDYWLRLFEDVETTRSARIPAKCTLTIEPRSDELVNLAGEPFSYPKAADGNQYEGTYIKIKSSYAQSGEELLSWVREWFEHLDSTWGTDLTDHFDPILETFYVGGLERYVRFDISAIERGVFTADNTKRLCHTGGERESRHSEDFIENGRFKIFQFSTTELGELGFKEGPHNEEGELAVKSDKLKIYRADNAHRYGPDDYRHHPKFETRINEGKFHVNEWNSLVARADSVLLTHLDYAAITEADLVSDDFFQPLSDDGEPVEEHPTRQPTEYAHPTGRMAELRKYWMSDETRRSLEGLVFHSQTESYRDILIALNFKFSGAVTYKQLIDATGLSYSGVRRAVRELVDARILTRISDHVTYVDWANQFAYEKGRAWLREHLDPRDALDEMAARAVDREDHRKKLNPSSDVGADNEANNKEEAEKEETPVTTKEENEPSAGYEGLTPSERREIEQQMDSGELPTFTSGTLMADGGTD
jgi:DNA-binding Lrp family transcriptional regulator